MSKFIYRLWCTHINSTDSMSTGQTTLALIEICKWHKYFVLFIEF